MDIIAVDIGNSLISIGYFTDDNLFVQKINTFPQLFSSRYGALMRRFIKEKNVDKTYEGVIISSVAPGLTDAVSAACKTLSKKEPVILTHRLNTGMNFQIKEPGKLGTDRIASAAGACNLFGSPVAVIDFGTATTLNFIGKENTYRGGAILPGLALMKDALFARTAQLPDVELSKPSSPLGRDTAGNILSGIVYGTAGAAEKIIYEVEKMEKEDYGVVITGGGAGLVSPFLRRPHQVEPALVLKGLKFIYGLQGETHNA